MGVLAGNGGAGVGGDGSGGAAGGAGEGGSIGLDAASTSGTAGDAALDSGVADGSAAGMHGSLDGGAADVQAATSPDAGSCPGLFCEDFESGQIDPSKWDIQMGGAGTQAVEQKIVSHGKYAWNVHGTGAMGDFAMILTKNAPAALQGSGPVFGRAYFYAASFNSPHVELGFAGTTGYPKLNYMEFAGVGTTWELGFDLFTPAPSVATGFVEEASYPHPSSPMPFKTWTCVEWEFNDNPDVMTLWIDGKQVAQFDSQHIDYTSGPRTAGSVLNGKSDGIIGGFAVFGFGFHAWHPSQAAIDLYYDDIVLDTKRVSCLEP